MEDIRGGSNIAQGNALGILETTKNISPKGAAPSISQGSALGEGCGEGNGAPQFTRANGAF
jgi:hypothetical protein